MNYKIPQTKEDYAYYGSEYKNEVEAIKYCHDNEDKIKNSSSEAIGQEYKELRSSANNYNSDKPYPIPLQKPLGKRIGYYTIYLPLAVITSPLWITSYLEEKSNKPKELKTIKEHIGFCDEKYIVPDINKKIKETKYSITMCEIDMREDQHNNPWHQYQGYATFRKIKSNSSLGYLLRNYNSDKSLYKGVDEFDLEKAKFCVNFYKDLEQKDKETQKQAKVNNAKNKAFASKLGYEDLYQNGLLALDGAIITGDISLNKAKKLLIKKDDGMDLTLVVRSSLNDIVIYSSAASSKLMVAIKKESGKFYGQGSFLDGKYFAVAGTSKLETTRGPIEMVVYKKIE